MQQQPENAFCNLTDTLNNINNNKFNNGHDEDFMMEQASPQHVEQNAIELNDDNNNSNDNLGPETDVDAIDEDFQPSAIGAVSGEKEKIQMEFKETEDVADRAEFRMDFGVDHTAAIYDKLENKIFGTMSLQNPDLIQGDNPFMSEDTETVPDVLADAEALIEHSREAAAAEDFMDNKLIEKVLQAEAQHHFDDYADSMENFHYEKSTEAMNILGEGVADIVDQLTSATEDIERVEKQQQAQEAGESCYSNHLTAFLPQFLNNSRNKFRNCSWLVFARFVIRI